MVSAGNVEADSSKGVASSLAPGFEQKATLGFRCAVALMVSAGNVEADSSKGAASSLAPGFARFWVRCVFT